MYSCRDALYRIDFSSIGNEARILVNTNFMQSTMLDYCANITCLYFKFFHFKILHFTQERLIRDYGYIILDNIIGFGKGEYSS